METVSCRLCQSSCWLIEGVEADSRSFYQCKNCQMIQVAFAELPDLKKEKEHYDTHQNGPEYPGYLNFLNKSVKPMLPFLNKGMKGLDYGCGPVPTVSYLLEKKGVSCENYDPIYFPGNLYKLFDFLFATECIEHFHHPGIEMEKLDELVKPGGMVAVMTETYESVTQFKNWYYIRDYTHVSFFHRYTLEYIAQKNRWDMVYTDYKRVFIFKKHNTKNDRRGKDKGQSSHRKQDRKTAGGN